jgi:8-oxo-dGTP pyrophosphatase MutT (NUDIX family)
MIERFVTFVETNAACFDRSLPAGHVTGSAWLVNRSGSHVLLTHHRKLDLWIQLGGHADGNPDIFGVALQEAREESGIDAIEPVSKDIFDIDIHTIPPRKNEPEHLHYDVRFALRTLGSEAYIVSDESHDLEWVEIARLQEKTADKTMLRMAEKWLTFCHSQ